MKRKRWNIRIHESNPEKGDGRGTSLDPGTSCSIIIAMGLGECVCVLRNYCREKKPKKHDDNGFQALADTAEG